MNFNQLVSNLLNESKDYFSKKITFKDEDGKIRTGTIVDPEVVEAIDTEECHGAHITDEWYGANTHFLGKNFNTEDPAWYIVATGSWETCPTQGDFHIVSAKIVNKEMLKQSLSPDTKDSFGGLIDAIG
jgi:hypothetical protein